MRHIKFLQRLGIACLVFATFGRASAQTILWNPNYAIGTSTGKYSFSYNQTPDQLVVIYPAWIFLPGGAGYQWEQSTVPVLSGFGAISGATSNTYNIPQAPAQDMWYRLKTYSLTTPGNYVYSNIIKISLVSANWEDLNYVREYDIDTAGITDWKTVDQLPIGEKLQTTTYSDGLGRAIQKVSKGVATPAAGSPGTWGDMVQFFQYDQYGREPLKFLAYTTTTQSGFYKTTATTEQPQYYSTLYNESSPESYTRFDNSPVNRIVNIKESGTTWAAAPGMGLTYDVNSSAENVQMFTADYVQGDAPANNGPYPANTLYKLTYTDENNNQIVEYTDKAGRLILKKVQLIPSPSVAHSGWACTYYIYDDYGLLRYKIQPEGVKYLDANSWSFAGANGAQVLAEQCFQYNYDDRSRPIWKKSPGAAPQISIYDSRDRLVFTQDGNQNAKSPGEWTATLYDGLDRPTLTTLYETSETIAQLQSDINNAASTTTINSFGSQSNSVTNLNIYSRNTSIRAYTASNSIVFYPDSNFVTPDGDNFVAQISPITETTLPVTVTTISLGNPISAANLANSSVTTILKYYFYDNYSFNNVASFNTSFTNTTAYPANNPDIMPVVTDPRTLDMPTGSLTRVLGTNMFLAETNYYDVKGRSIQTLHGNIRGGTDITTIQHHFDDRLLSKCYSHTDPSSPYSAYITLTKYLYDKIGRVTSIQKSYGSNPLKTIAGYDYDDQGRLLTKHLDPAFNNGNSGSPDLESLNYTYNIHNQITGINKDYALKNPASYNKWSHFFGMYLGYDNRDGAFAHAQLDGQVTGQMWNTLGDDAQRKYDYTYDNSNRLLTAAFNQQQHPGDGWSNATMNFSVNGASGQITYDNNGNLLTMLQKGVIPGTASPITIDDLRYQYNSYSNKLFSVTDAMTTTTVNGQSGDFADGTNAAGTADYVYDNNGNLVIDINKNVQTLNNGTGTPNGVNYNFLDKPDQIRVVGKGTIKIVYSADGEKLQRVFIPETTGALSTVKTYIDEFEYESRGTLTLSSAAPFMAGTADTLNYIEFEEGRIRAMTPGAPVSGIDVFSENGNFNLLNGQVGVWDYFVLDYQKNVRMVLTEEQHIAGNTCTMETSNGRSTTEDGIFGQPGAANEVEATRTATPSGWTGNSSSFVSQLGNLAGHIIGPNTLQKVMAGDSVSASVLYYYQGAVTNSNPNIVPNILNSLAGAIGGASTMGSLVHGNAANITGQLSGNPAFVTAVEPAGAGGSTPQAFLNILFFDERFNLIAAADGGVVQQQVASSWTSSTPPLALMNYKAPKNGYVFVYVSNRSDQSVYFDNLAVTIHAGNITEENHYYPFGLRIAGISSKKLGDVGEGGLKNNFLFNDKEFYDDASLDWYDYGFRNYDPQIGRFVQLDPLSDDYPFLTPYQFAGNDPIANVDEDGLEPAAVTSFIKSLGSDATVLSVRFITTGTAAGKWSVTFIKDGVACAETFKAASTVLTTTSKVVSVAVKAADVATDFIPVVSGAKDIYRGIKSGNGWQVALGVGSIVLDVFTFGSSSIAKGAIKTAVREGAEIILKEEAEQVVKKEITETVVKDVVTNKSSFSETKQLLLEAPKYMEKHHIFPQEFKDFFKLKKIPINKYTVKISRELHQLLHEGAGGGVWNAKWAEFIRTRGAAASQSEIFKFAEDLLHEARLEHLKYVKYR